jgi:hypothetical protein
VSSTKFEASSAPAVLERAAYTVAEFCFRNNIGRLTYHRLRADGRGPTEMRLGLNAIRITADAEREWQRRMQEPREDLETRAIERAAKAGNAAAKSDKHVSKRRRAMTEQVNDARNRAEAKAAARPQRKRHSTQIDHQDRARRRT